MGLYSLGTWDCSMHAWGCSTDAWGCSLGVAAWIHRAERPRGSVGSGVGTRAARAGGRGRTAHHPRCEEIGLVRLVRVRPALRLGGSVLHLKLGRRRTRHGRALRPADRVKAYRAPPRLGVVVEVHLPQRLEELGVVLRLLRRALLRAAQLPPLCVPEPIAGRRRRRGRRRRGRRRLQDGRVAPPLVGFPLVVSPLELA